MSGNNAVRFADLFCGIGGIRIGMERAGFECVFSCDTDAECQRTYAANFGETPHGDIRGISEKDVSGFDVLCAGFPCQPFSISGRQKGFSDDRGTLFFEICRFAQEKLPKVILLENVKHLTHHDSGRTLDAILSRLRAMGYVAEWKILNALDFGVPQNRERAIIVASRTEAFDFEAVKTSERRILAGCLDERGDFEFLDTDTYTLIENPKIQERSGLCFAGYRNKPIRKTGVRPGTEHLSRVHKQPNRIYSVMGTHPTLLSQESFGRCWILLGDSRVRKLTSDECFRIMGFPSGFARPSPVCEQYRQIGNSVCIPMIEAVATAIGGQYFGKSTND